MIYVFEMFFFMNIEILFLNKKIAIKRDTSFTYSEMLNLD